MLLDMIIPHADHLLRHAQLASIKIDIPPWQRQIFTGP